MEPTAATVAALEPAVSQKGGEEAVDELEEAARVVVLRATVRVATLNGALALRNADVAIILSVRLCCTPDR